MNDEQPTDAQRDIAEEARKHLLGSTTADIVGGSIATVIWWGLAVAVVSRSSHSVGPASGIIFCLFASQVLAVGLCSRKANIFIITQLLAAILLPVLAAGLAFGACLIGGGPSFH